MKKIFFAFIAVLLLVSLTFLSSCGPTIETTPCVEHLDTDGDHVCDVCGSSTVPACNAHKDENADKLCDNCGVEFFPRCVTHTDVNENYLCDLCGKDLPIDVTFSLKDQEGTVISGVTVLVTNDEFDEYTFVTDENGCGVISLHSGTYKVSYDTISEDVYFPEGYLPIPSTVTVSVTNKNIEIEILKTVPNGEADRPFPIDEKTPEISIPSATLYYYIIYHSSGRNVSFEGSDFKVVYGDNEYLPDADGRIDFTLAEIEANKNSHLTIENLSNEEITVKFSISSDPGSYSNPFDITHGDDDVIANVANGGVNYKYVASADGVVTIMTTQMLMFKTSIMAESKPLVRVSGESDGYFGVWQLDIGDVIYTLTVSKDSILIEDNDESSASIRGTYTYTVSEDGEFALTSKDDASKELDVTLFEGGNTIVATRSSDSSQIVIDGNVKSKTISVTAGDEIRIMVNSEFSDEVSFKLLFEESEA